MTQIAAPRSLEDILLKTHDGRHYVAEPCGGITELEGKCPLHDQFDRDPEWMSEYLRKHRMQRALIVGETGYGFVPLAEVFYHLARMQRGYVYGYSGNQLYRITVSTETVR